MSIRVGRMPYWDKRVQNWHSLSMRGSGGHAHTGRAARLTFAAVTAACQPQAEVLPGRGESPAGSDVLLELLRLVPS